MSWYSDYGKTQRVPQQALSPWLGLVGLVKRKEFGARTDFGGIQACAPRSLETSCSQSILRTPSPPPSPRHTSPGNRTASWTAPLRDALLHPQRGRVSTGASLGDALPAPVPHFLEARETWRNLRSRVWGGGGSGVGPTSALETGHNLRSRSPLAHSPQLR